MVSKVLEINVDDLNMGGVFSLVKNVIIHNHDQIQIDIAAVEKFSSQENVQLFKKRGTEVYYVGYEGNKWLKQLICFHRLKKLIKEKKYECVHIHADVANKLLISGLAAKCAGVKKIILHSHAAGVDGKHRNMKETIHKLCRRFLKQIGTDFVACSDVAATWMYPDIPLESIVLVKNGIDLKKFRYDESIREKIRCQLNVEKKIVVGHVGRFCYQKNHDYFIKILQRIKKRDANMVLLLIGEGPDEQSFRNKLKEQNLEDNVVFYGVSQKVQELFMAMDVFVLPSHFEGLPIVGVEAQATGLPVIFSDKITKEAQLREDVVYLGIEDNDADIWVDNILQFAERKCDRQDAYIELKNKKFDIEDTINTFMTLYKG